jgi:uncharacterized protein (TIGR02145 family)
VRASVTAGGVTCQSANAANKTANVQALPATPGITASAGTVCQNAALTFYVTSPVAGATYTWSASAGTANGSSYTFNTATTGAKTATVNAKVSAGGVTCQSANATNKAANVQAPAQPTITASAASVCQTGALTFYVTSPVANATYTWTASAGTANGSSYTFNTATTGAKTATVNANIMAGGVTCQSANAANRTTTVHAPPTISLISGNNQAPRRGASISAIVFATTNADGASMTSGSLPNNLTGAWSSSSYRISGTIASNATFGAHNFTVTTSNAYGCSNATAAATITVLNVPSPPPNARTSETWVLSGEEGYQVWSDVINLPGCNKTSYTASETKADCRSGFADSYLYSWLFVIKNADLLCPSPWRVPTVRNACRLDALLFDTYICDYRPRDSSSPYHTKWGAVTSGYCDAQGKYSDTYLMGGYWCNEEYSGETSAIIAIRKTETNATSEFMKSHGLHVRCVFY